MTQKYETRKENCVESGIERIAQRKLPHGKWHGTTRRANMADAHPVLLEVDEVDAWLEGAHQYCNPDNCETWRQ